MERQAAAGERPQEPGEPTAGRGARETRAIAGVRSAKRPAEALEIVKRRRGLAFEPPGQAAHLVVQPVEGRGVFGRAGHPGGIGRLRQLVEPRMKLVERFAVAALALLDALDQAAQKSLDRLLIHGPS